MTNKEAAEIMQAIIFIIDKDYYSDEVETAIHMAINALTAQPEIIACGDCKHWICHDRRCGYWNHGVGAIDWCSHAERRTDG